MKTLEDALKISDIHADRMELAIKELPCFLISAETLEHLSLHSLGMYELYTNRFARLQDQLGRKVFPLLLKDLGDFDKGMTFRDVWLKLEKLGIVMSYEEWDDLRKIRNDISHEYLDDYQKIADALNE